MRAGVTIVHLGGSFGPQQHTPPLQHHHITPPAAGWKSPVPYLFGGLAAMLGLIAFALLILACSYWKLSGYLDAGEDSGEVTGDEKLKENNVTATSIPCSVLVIMAGEAKPTFLAMPASSKASSLASCSSGGTNRSGGESEGGGGEEKMGGEEDKSRERTT
ncbi:protein GLUTAMINE DUMPER 4-like [Chenopodium quinoa]|uniref:protein GLUTAMINE DUMPER 4-like n=1 Tax=Chenopodium quinoa TaxID=63459 RepID=UPI000B77D745|nr:protein GLUTAMINE DUMPER 4-like [Chenopodium quinoa]